MRFWACIVLVCLLAGTASAASVDPSVKWKTIRTKHFDVHFEEKLESVAQDTARILEEVHAELSPKMHWTPWGPTQVLLLDNTDESNGFTSVMPYNWMILFVSQPPADSQLATYDNWLRTLIIHEYTHLLQFDANRGFWKPLRLIFGKSIAPAGITPGWVKEGSAVYNESSETNGGRNRASYSDMLLRSAILENDFPTIDRADGVHWRWPAYNTAYIFGGKFIEYLVDTYGWEKFWDFNRRIQSSPLITMVNHQARNVYHKTFYELWREWEALLKEKYTSLEETLAKKGITETDNVVLPEWEDQYAYPALSPDGKKLAYMAHSPHRATRILIKDLETGKDTKIGQKKVTGIAWSPDGTKVVFSALGSYKRFYHYNDLWMYDVEKKKTTRLTTGKRAREPSFSPNSEKIIFLSEKSGHDTIDVIDIETKKINTITDENIKYAHYATPRFSPDGGLFAAGVWTPKEGWKIYVFSVDGRQKTRLTKGTGAESFPYWMPDQNSIIYSSDETGISNIYSADVKTGKATQITNVVTGVFQPVTQDGRTIYVQQYDAKGFYISSFASSTSYAESIKGKKAESELKKKEEGLAVGASEGLGFETEEALEKEYTKEDFKSQKYCHLGRSLLLPRFLLPYVAYISDAAYFSAMTGGSDALHWHNWIAGGTYRTDADFIGYFADYTYNRWLPVFSVGVNDYAADLGLLTFRYADGTSRTVHYYEERRNIHGFVSVPVNNHNFLLGYYYEDRMPITSLSAAERSVLNLGEFAGFLGRYTYNDAERYPASISPENGRNIKLTGYVSDAIFGAQENNEQIVFSGDWREYIRLWHHHVLALRAAGGMTWGDNLVQATFAMGGDIGEGVFAQGGGYNYFALRGLPVSVLSGTRAMLLSSEYRFPIFSPQRGAGTWPLFIDNLHAAVFADYGDAWYAQNDRSDFKKFFENFLLGVGMELRGDFIIGHGLPVTGRLGYAIIVVNRDRLQNLTAPILGTDLKYGMMILQVGTSF